jgi:regulator of sigma E protease
MNIVISIFLILFWFVIILIPLIAIHEMGHFLFSKLMGVRVVEYGIGIPPRAVSKRWKKVIWSLNWLPLGGFAKIYGDHDAVDAAEDIIREDKEKAREVYRENRIAEIVASKDLQYFLEDNNIEYTDEWKKFEQFNGVIEEGSSEAELYTQLSTLVDWEFDEVIESKTAFCNVSWWRKSFILLGGVTFNLLTAMLIFFIIFGFLSTPVQPVLPDDIDALRERADITFQSDEVKVLRVIPETPAETVGLESGDDFISFNNVQINSISNFDEFGELVRGQEDPTVTIVYRDSDTGIVEEKDVDLIQNDDGEYYFGLRSVDLGYLVRFRSNSLGDAFVASFDTTRGIFMLNFQVLGDVLLGVVGIGDRAAVEQVGGPVAVGSLGSFVFDVQGAVGILNIMAVVSVALAAFNLLPIPALDGGRFVIVTINALTGKRNKRLEGVIIGATFMVMLALAAVIAFYDIYRISTGGLGF